MVLIKLPMTGYNKSFARWLVLELAATIYGHKPATILSLQDRPQMPWYSLWEKCGDNIIARTRLKYKILRETPVSKVIFFYHPENLEKCIAQSGHRDFLAERGYPVGQGLERCLALLQQRFQQGCPHEVGLLLGIPLKDVLGFMGLNPSPLTCTGLWCVYGEPSCSLALMEGFVADRKRVIELLGRGHNPLKLLCS